MANQKAAHTASSIILVPTLFNFEKGIGLPLNVHPKLHVSRNRAQAIAVTLLVKLFIKSVMFSIGISNPIKEEGRKVVRAERKITSCQGKIIS